MNSYMNNIRVAWLLTSAFYYWHPMLSCLTRLLPKTTAYAANWVGYAQGFEDTFSVEIVGQRKVISVVKSETSYGSNFTYMPLAIVNRLFQFKPQVIFSNSFGMWTMLSLLLKPWGQWRVVIAYEGSSPGVDFRNSPVRLALRRVMVHLADACITNSHAGQQYLIEVLNTPPGKVFRQPYEVPSATELLKSAEAVELRDLPAQKPVFVFVGSLKPRKGLHLLLKACALLKQQGCADYTLWVVGDGPQRQELESFCQQHDLTEQIEWIGHVNYECVGAYFHKADVFILPTLEDTWGVVVSEAMALSKAVLCSRFAGASELVLEGENGYVFDPNDESAIASAMRRFIDNRELSDRMGKRSAQIMSQYTPEAAADFMAKVTSLVLQS
jgi:glycosyltransferase involved in cell wall biosynthesis